MRVHCDDEESGIRLPNQQQQQQQQHQQQQQQTIVEEQPHHTLTTPAWGSSDTTVQKEETSDDRNDSGMSPGDYSSNSTSPMSGRSFSVANCSLSPESVSSPDSIHLESNSGYNTQEMFNQCRVSQDLRPNGDSNATSNDSTWSDSFQCPVCNDVSTNRDSFSEHLISHYGNRSENIDIRRNGTESPVPGPSGVSRRRGSRNRGEQSENHETEEAGLRVPRVNSQGRVKTFRCKQCSFLSVTKLEFWEHSRVHIRADKLLTCPNCPFVTEYKHHLEYHLRNHYGSKPFKCDKCSYTCVNKSMLNSHLKSHSNIYQYRCADCIYATKYCHSLKLHLRKYTHLPAMVLNADGSPNPLPIIDIYGTRRGPKNKTKAQRLHVKTTRASRANRSENARRSNAQETIVTTAQTPTTISLETSMNLAITGPSTSDLVSDVNSQTNGVVNDANTVSRSPLMAYNPVLTDISVPNQNPVEETQERLIPLDLSVREQCNSNENTNGIDQSRKRLLPSTKAKSTSRRKGKAYKLDRRQVISENESDELITSELRRRSESTTRVENPIPNLENGIEKHQSEGSSENHHSEDSSENHQLEGPRENYQQAGSSNNHQSKGCSENHKLENRLEKTQSENCSENHQSKGNEINYLEELPCYQIDYQVPSCSRDPCPATNPASFVCRHCEIAFANALMYSAHMSFHTPKNPYTCKQCGHECKDKIDFFIHIGNSEH
ncbi:protein hunchback-like [Polistes fuscatus]|uniref:protein hunchback-like n=1 Tax=Polistes fuscatus TaxID=30207 RepID=UPI001CA9C2BB|nr:protein hunchback-like [Polistes fuscatus]